MTVEDLIEELKQHPLTARVEVLVRAESLFNAPDELSSHDPDTVVYERGVVTIECDC